MLVLNLPRTGENITKLMKRDGISVKELAEKMCLHIQSIYQWRQGHTIPTMDNIILLMSIFNVGLTDIVALDDVEEKR